jgi:hypothetical protein
MVVFLVVAVSDEGGRDVWGVYANRVDAEARAEEVQMRPFANFSEVVVEEWEVE